MMQRINFILRMRLPQMCCASGVLPPFSPSSSSPDEYGVMGGNKYEA